MLKKLNQPTHPKIWGNEQWICNTDLYCGKILTVNEGYRCSLHCHKIKDEVFYILSGVILFEHINQHDEKTTMTLTAGDSVRVKPLELHRFSGIEDSKIIEFSTQHRESDSYRLEPSGKFDRNTLTDIITRHTNT